jgi:pyridoxal phosphate enzyme (YggS family)
MIKDNIKKLKERVSIACSKSNRDVSSVTVVAVSKGRTPEQIQEAVNAGLFDIGENKVQEALVKYRQLTPNTKSQTPIRWHMVGHLQTNKVKEAVKIFDTIQSVDSLHLALAIDAQAARIRKVQDILIEVNVSGETAKFGLKPGQVTETVKSIVRLEYVRIKGLMTVAPVADNPEKSRPYFGMLKALLDELNRSQVTGYGLEVLSMGMTDDFQAAIEEGSTMVRVGRAIFEG